MLLEDISNYLYNAKKFGDQLLKIENLKDSDYKKFEQSFNQLCLKALMGTLEFFSISSLINIMSIDKELLKEFLLVNSKAEFREFCKKALIKNQSN